VLTSGRHPQSRRHVGQDVVGIQDKEPPASHWHSGRGASDIQDKEPSDIQVALRDKRGAGISPSLSLALECPCRGTVLTV
jgi:hypothetical protein